MTLWFDVDDLIAYFNAHRRPSGIQRLCLELYRKVWELEGKSGNIRFCRHNKAYTGLVEIDWPALERRIDELTAKAHANTDAISAVLAHVDAAEPISPQPSDLSSFKRAPIALRLLAKTLLTAELRNAVGTAYYSATTPRLRVWRSFHAALRYFSLLRPLPKAIEAATIDLKRHTLSLRQGDIIIALGSLWDSPFAVLVAKLRRDHGVGFATMFHDAIPKLFPEFTGEGAARIFSGWLNATLPQADIIFTNSRASANDLTSAMAEINHSVPELCVLPIGAERRAVAASISPLARPFVLFVSTIEPRKNHMLMLAVWARMLELMAPDDVPDLVFAGRVMVDIAEMLDKVECPALRNHLVLVSEPEDDLLSRLYSHCLFTVFPSLYEGWGLPVTESLSFGKTVAASNRTSIPEAGGEFCAYYDPENVDEAYQVIRGMIEHPEQVAALETLIANKFSPPSWTDTAAVLLDSLSKTKIAPRGDAAEAKIKAAA